MAYSIKQERLKKWKLTLAAIHKKLQEQMQVNTKLSPLKGKSGVPSRS